MSASTAPVGHRPVDLVPMPARVAGLPRNQVGYPIPWFVATLDDGVRDFRVGDLAKMVDATNDKLCWICGGRLGAFMTFVIGPMCAVNTISGEPPSHRDCATYAARVCPFLSRPDMQRRPGGKPDDTVPAAGVMLERNPGVALVWTTRSYKPFNPDRGNAGILYEIGRPTEVSWWVQGRAATRAEILDSIQAGLPALIEVCKLEDDPGRATAELDRRVDRAMTLLPA